MKTPDTIDPRDLATVTGGFRLPFGLPEIHFGIGTQNGNGGNGGMGGPSTGAGTGGAPAGGAGGSGGAGGGGGTGNVQQNSLIGGNTVNMGVPTPTPTPAQ
jgi:hypothetical protein